MRLRRPISGLRRPAEPCPPTQARVRSDQLLGRRQRSRWWHPASAQEEISFSNPNLESSDSGTVGSVTYQLDGTGQILKTTDHSTVDGETTVAVADYDYTDHENSDRDGSLDKIHSTITPPACAALETTDFFSYDDLGITIRIHREADDPGPAPGPAPTAEQAAIGTNVFDIPADPLHLGMGPESPLFSGGQPSASADVLGPSIMFNPAVFETLFDHRVLDTAGLLNELRTSGAVGPVVLQMPWYRIEVR